MAALTGADQAPGPRFEITDEADPGGYDIAVIDMTKQGGADAARELRDARGLPVIRVGRRDSDDPRGRDDLNLDRLQEQAIGALNDAAQLLTVRQQTRWVGVLAGERAPRALVVDPAVEVRRALAEALKSIGVDAEGVSSVREAREVIEIRNYELVILEPDTPEGKDLDIARELRAGAGPTGVSLGAPGRLPVIVLSRRASVLDQARGVLAGCEAYLAKPVPLETLHATVARILRARGHRIA